jgi:hypothetical protein
MDNESLKVFLGSFAEQQYMFSLLVKMLEEKQILKRGEFMQRYAEKDKYQFSHDLLEELVSRGLSAFVRAVKPTNTGTKTCCGPTCCN